MVFRSSSSSSSSSKSLLASTLGGLLALAVALLMLVVAQGQVVAANTAATSSEAGRVWFELGEKRELEGDLEGAADAMFRALTSGYVPVTDAFRRFVGAHSKRGRPEAAYLRLGKSFQIQENLDSARESYNNAIKLADGRRNEDVAEAYFFLAGLTADQEAALLLVRKATEIAPRAEFFHHLGTMLFGLGKDFGSALEAFVSAHKLDPNMSHAFGNMVYLKTRVCDWEGYDEYLNKLKEHCDKNLAEIKAARAKDQPAPAHFFHPHMTLALPLDPKLKLEITRTHALAEKDAAVMRMGKPYTYTPKDFEGPSNKRIRVGFLSADFKLKATAYLVQAMFRFFDREKFEVFCFANTVDSPLRMRELLNAHWRDDIAASVEHFVDLSGKSVEQIVHLIHDKYKIHILVNYDGYSNNGIRAEGVFPMQPAPLQVSHLVYVGSIGLPAIQYVVTDPLASPAEYDEYYSEKFIWLQQSFFVNSHALVPALGGPPHPDKVQARPATLPFRYCNFNKHLKISPTVFTMWCEIIRQVIKSGREAELVLLLYPAESEPRLRAFMKANFPDLSPNVLKFLPFVDRPDLHQRRMAEACDLVLDNRKYNAHTMAVDTLWGGTPLLTFGDDTDFGGRVATSILMELGLDELVAFSDDEYRTMAVHMATDPELHRSIRLKIAQTAQPSEKHGGRINPFWDTARYVANLENGFEAIWKRFLRGEEPAHVLADKASDEEAARRDEWGRQRVRLSSKTKKNGNTKKSDSRDEL